LLGRLERQGHRCRHAAPDRRPNNCRLAATRDDHWRQRVHAIGLRLLTGLTRGLLVGKFLGNFRWQQASVGDRARDEDSSNSYE
jgi:hypothetical protein